MNESLLSERLRQKLYKGGQHSQQRRSINQKDLTLRSSAQVHRQIMSQCFNSPVTSSVNLKDYLTREGLKSGGGFREEVHQRQTFFSEIDSLKRT
jgi:hypothetical protein